MKRIDYFLFFLFIFIIPLKTSGNYSSNYPTAHISFNQQKSYAWSSRIKSLQPSSKEYAAFNQWTHRAFGIRSAQRSYSHYPSNTSSYYNDELSDSETFENNHLQSYRSIFAWDKHADIIRNRENALDYIDCDLLEKTHTYSVSKKTMRFCDTHDINIDFLQTYTGNCFEHQLHNEFLMITEESSRLWRKQSKSINLQNGIAILADFTCAGITFNHEHATKKAQLLADTCWMLLDCLQAAGEGFIQGMYTAVYDITHPIKTAQNIAESALACGYYLSQVAQEIGGLGYVILLEAPEKTYKKLEIWQQNFNEHGCYQVNLIINSEPIPKTFFPSYWSREKVIQKIKEAYEDFKKRGITADSVREKYLIRGFTSEGIEIEMCFNVTGEMRTAYPVIEEINI